MKLADALKKYLEEQTKTDPALAKVYDINRIKECSDYVFNQAKKIKTGNYAFVEDAVVFKWARDFFYGDIDNSDITNDKANTVKPEEIEVKKATVISKKDVKKTAEKTDTKNNDWDMSLFADLSEDERGSNNA